MKLYISHHGAVTEAQGVDMPDFPVDRDPKPEECMRIVGAVLQTAITQDIEEMRASGKIPILLITLVRKNETTAFAHAENLAENPAFAEMFEEDIAGPDEFIAMVQEPVNCTELDIEFHPIWSALCCVCNAGPLGQPRDQAWFATRAAGHRARRPTSQRQVCCRRRGAGGPPQNQLFKD